MTDGTACAAGDPLVSVAMITYNHAPYIAQAIAGVLMQRTTFPIEVVIGEDCSTDDTREIVLDYQRRFPEVLRVVISETNVGIRKNAIRTRTACRGKYIAFCEGDDYWTDPHKLERQAAFLEAHSEYGVCCHYVLVHHEERKTFLPDHWRGSLDLTQRDLLLGNKRSVRTCSMMCRRDCIPTAYPEELLSAHAGDNILRLLLTEKHRLYVLPAYMACYRVHSGGTWSFQSRETLWKRQTHDLSLLSRYFGEKYPDVLRYRRDMHDFIFADLIATEQGAGIGLLSALRILKYPKYAFRHPLRVAGKVIRTAIAPVVRRSHDRKARDAASQGDRPRQ